VHFGTGILGTIACADVYVIQVFVRHQLHIIARAEGWGLQDMPPQPLQTVWLGNSSFWSRYLLTKDSGSPLLDPVHDAGITGSFFGPKPKELWKADHATRTALFYRALQVTVVYIPFNIHSKHWVYFKIELATNTITLHDPLPPPLQTQTEIMLFIGKPIGGSEMISNATNPLKKSRKESLLRCAGSTSICEWLVCDLVVMCIQAVGDRALGDICVCVRCGPFRVRKYESVVIGFRHQGGSC